MFNKSRIKHIAISVVLLLIAVSFIKSTVDVLKNTQRLREQKESLVLLEQQKTQLEQQVAYKKTQEFIEESARDDLNMIKPGEHVYVVSGLGVDPETFGGSGSDSADSGFTNNNSSVAENSRYGGKNWYRWYKLFF